jgi:acetolactate synthase-1/2/3 large subunit
MKYSDQMAVWLKDIGYEYFYFVGGGNIMHLTESLDRHLKAIPVIHEVAAVIAAEYHNQIAGSEKALALVTAGPGITNTATGLAGAYLESRYVLVIGGQVKTEDLSSGLIRQNGIQEIDGVSLCRSITSYSVRLEKPIDKQSFTLYALAETNKRKAPVFLEVPLDVQACHYESNDIEAPCYEKKSPAETNLDDFSALAGLLETSERPVFLLGAGVNTYSAAKLEAYAKQYSIPIATTWNAADKLPHDSATYIGRPNTWGQRSSNILVQQADLVICLGTRLGLQQTGFNWQGFVPHGKVAAIELDVNELHKGHPVIDLPIVGDCNIYIAKMVDYNLGRSFEQWLVFCKDVRCAIPLVEEGVNELFDGFIAPQYFVSKLSDCMTASDILIPCSSGSAFTTAMQCFKQKRGQKIVTNKGLASMGYGLAGSIGAALASGRRTILIEGDGGFSQNMQELGTVSAQNLNIKIFIFDDAGHASIRMTQKNYFSGKYIGCDIETSLGLPNWDKIGDVWNIESMRLSNIDQIESPEFKHLYEKEGPAIFIVSICPHQTYFPKISSRVLDNGAMESNPLHQMCPPLSDEISRRVFKYIDPHEH